MARSILVPLDGSRLSEAALPHALLLARALGASITLLHVVEKSAPERVHGEAHVGTVEEAETYLAGIQARLEAGGVTASRHVHPGPVSKVARSIAEHRLEIPYDMAVVCTHGGFGAGRALFGSVGQRVLADASVPVLVVRPDGGSPELRLILVALAAQHASSLPLAAELARATGARVHLLMVIPTFETRRGGMRLIGRYLPGATAEAFDQEIGRASCRERVY
jgi:nucleotide-binding universal stress UspA family protein